MITFKNIACAAVLAAVLSICAPAFAREDVEYRKFKLERSDCDVALMYVKSDNGYDLGVSAIATGKGAEFRKWTVSDIKLRIDDERIRPDTVDKFYVTEESFWRIPAAVLFAALGTQVPVSGSGLEQGIGKAGMAIGLGLLVLAAKGDIAGEKCVFRLDRERSERAFAGNAFAEIVIEDVDMHWKDTVRVGIVKPSASSDSEAVYRKMAAGELTKLIDDLGGRVGELEKEQGSFKYGVDPEFNRIQSDIEGLQTQRGLAYKVWFEKSQDTAQEA